MSKSVCGAHRAGLGWLATVVACVAYAAPDPAPVVVSSLEGTNWTLVDVGGQIPVAGSTPTLSFAEGRVQGIDGCNQYSGSYTLAGTTLRVGPDLMSTMMGCPEEIMAQASAFTKILIGAPSYRIADHELQLLEQDAKPAARFRAQSVELAGTSWRVTGYNNGQQAVVSVLAGTTLTMQFGGDGRLSGSAGCNHYSASYESTGLRIVIGPATSTRMMCARPEAIMDQEQQFLRSVATASALRVDGDRLELRAADGSLALTLTREFPPK